MGHGSLLCYLEAYTTHHIHLFNRVVDDSDYRIRVFQ